MKCVYVLVSTKQDYYYEQCLISVKSLLMHNPDAEIVILTDNRTKAGMTGFRAELQDICSRIVSVDFEDRITNKVRSRILKTTMRNLVEGDFLFLDLDTVIADDLEKIKQISADIACVLDKHADISEHYMYMYMNAKRLNYSVGYNNKHFNSGVMWVRDTDDARTFFKFWNQLYLEGLKKGIDVDQTSLNEANYRMNGMIYELEGIWNVQVNCGLKYISSAKVIHYLGFQPQNSQNKYFNSLPFELCNEKLLREVKNKEKVTDEVTGIIESPKTSFKMVTIIPYDCAAHTIIFSNHMRVLKFIYVKLYRVYSFFEKIYGWLFLRLFKRV